MHKDEYNIIRSNIMKNKNEYKKYNFDGNLSLSSLFFINMSFAANTKKGKSRNNKS